MVVLGSGGHTSEMLSILQALLDDQRAVRIVKYSFYCFLGELSLLRLHLVVAESDRGSITRANKMFESRSELNIEWHTIPRSREVGQR